MGLLIVRGGPFFFFFFYDSSSFPDTALIRAHVFSYACSLCSLGVGGGGGGGGGVPRSLAAVKNVNCLLMY